MDKQEQKKLITEVMNEDARDGVYKQTAVEWLALRYHHRQGYLSQEDIEQAKEMERQQQTQASTPHHKFKDEWGNSDWRDTGEMGG